MWHDFLSSQQISQVTKQTLRIHTYIQTHMRTNNRYIRPRCHALSNRCGGGATLAGLPSRVRFVTHKYLKCESAAHKSQKKSQIRYVIMMLRWISKYFLFFFLVEEKIFVIPLACIVEWLREGAKLRWRTEVGCNFPEGNVINFVGPSFFHKIFHAWLPFYCDFSCVFWIFNSISKFMCRTFVSAVNFLYSHKNFCVSEGRK